VFIVWLVPAGLGGAISGPIMLASAPLWAWSTAADHSCGWQPVVVTLAMYFILQGVDLVLSPQPQAMPGNRRMETHLAGSVGPIPGAVRSACHC